MYSVTRNWKPTYDPKRAIAPSWARIWFPDRSTPSRINGPAERRSTNTNTVSRTATARKERRVRADAQPTSGACTTVNTSNSIAPVPSTAPGTS